MANFYQRGGRGGGGAGGGGYRPYGDRGGMWHGGGQYVNLNGVPPPVGGIPTSQRREIASNDILAVEHVEVDPIVYLRMAKHARDNPVGTVRGVLLGFDQKVQSKCHRFLVTHAIPLPDGLDPDSKESTLYVESMIKLLNEVNIENLVIGWYSCASLSSCLDQRFLDDAVEYQDALNQKSVVLIYDPLQAEAGRFGLRALRVAPGVVKKRREQQGRSTHGNSHSTNISSLQADGLFQEIPIHMQCSPLVSAFLAEYAPGPDDEAARPVVDLRSLSLDHASYAEKHLSGLVEGLDNLTMGNSSNRVDLLTASQLKQTCADLKSYASETLDKLYVMSNAAANDVN